MTSSMWLQRTAGRSAGQSVHMYIGASGFMGGFQIGLSLATMNILSMGARASCPRIRVVAGETPALPYHARKRGVGRRQPKL